MIPSIHRPAYIEVDLNNIASNIKQVLNHLNNGEEIFAVVKANAYSHGIVEVSKTALESGATGLCVATLDEALEIRDAKINAPILVLGVTEATDVSLASEKNISLTVADNDWISEVKKQDFDKINIHLGIDSGMSRIGYTNREMIEEAITMIKADKRINPEGIFTHFATADDPDDTYFQQQLTIFHKLTDDLEIEFKYKHVANSATALWREQSDFNMVRLGIAMYGMNPSGTSIELPYKLKPAFNLYSELVFVKEVKPGTKIGYGATYTAEENQWIGTIPIGYADGWLRRMSGFEVLINGQRCPIVGRICMDQFMVRLPEKYKAGTKVTILGKDEFGNKITIQEAAEYADTINYEIVCSLSERLPRIY
ncbi:alanine racemase [Companilactobacillus sp. RD055328]|uniref:alanine racemase n=1 Tax=Companilactobacillus sp. RD055328 TaxID=2916634 RepID=UPI001FC8B830|nr:alanine racemase [Companilactobacillus sp. RD055328]GKQ42296.1 alanine racemase [Companilactobacillus sp. RD055328]